MKQNTISSSAMSPPIPTNLNQISLFSAKYSLRLLSSFTHLSEHTRLPELPDSSVCLDHSKQRFPIVLIDDPRAERLLLDSNAGADLCRVSYKRHLRIVSNPIEPFVIVSQLDDHLIAKNECRDGIPCLHIEPNTRSAYKPFRLQANLSRQMNDFFNNEHIIGLIQGDLT